MRFATYTADGENFYGAVTDVGMIALSPQFPDWPTLRDVIAADGLPALAVAAEGASAVGVENPTVKSVPGTTTRSPSTARRICASSQIERGEGGKGVRSGQIRA